ncbi:MAG: EF-P beta-lysylation protein EpmB [Pseudomonadales bacterium]|nr:EF-P beta-lysylation protein EpmB [Pseudomonadales bacterium]
MLKPLMLTTEPGWQEVLSDLLTDPLELLRLLDLNADMCGLSLDAVRNFPLRVPRPYLARIKPGDPHDPLLRQVLPVTTEMLPSPGFSLDPLGESLVNPQQGLLHKYHGRALLIVTSSCAIHCRYCFRRHFPYDDNNPGRRQWRQALEYLAADDSIEEIILSGGDPLAASDRHLQWLVGELEDIRHLRRLRIHTRLPIMIPQRITPELGAWLSASRLQKVVVIHCNHANELDDAVTRACSRLRDSGATLLNQSVLLKGINDSTEALITLSESLMAAGVLPYYLHLLDKVQGAVHFDVSEARARELIRALQTRLPGYLVPRLVREIAGNPSKTPVNIDEGPTPATEF